MEFISLSNVLVGIAKCINLPPLNMFNVSELGAITSEAADKFWNAANRDIGEHSLIERIEWAKKISFAALRLNKALHDSPSPIQWMEFDKAKRFAVRSDSVKQEGIDLLTHTTGWGQRELGNCFTHFRNSTTQGDDALATTIFRGQNDGLTPEGKEHRFLMEIGFDLSEVTRCSVPTFDGSD